MYTLKRLFFQSPGHYIAALILTVCIGAFRFTTLADGIDFHFAMYETLSVSGSVTFLIGALMTVSFLGAFDLFGFVFSSGRSREHRKYKDYVDYSQEKAEGRARGPYYFIPYYVIGTFVFLLSRLFV